MKLRGKTVLVRRRDNKGEIRKGGKFAKLGPRIFSSKNIIHRTLVLVYLVLVTTKLRSITPNCWHFAELEEEKLALCLVIQSLLNRLHRAWCLAGAN